MRRLAPPLLDLVTVKPYGAHQATFDATTTIKKPSYLGKVIKEGLVDYIYWETPRTQRNVNGVNGDEGTNKGINSPNAPDPIVNGSGGTCNATNGGMWNTEVAPFRNVGEFRQRLDAFGKGTLPALSMDFTCDYEDGPVHVRVLLARIRERSQADVTKSILVHIRRAS